MSHGGGGGHHQACMWVPVCGGVFRRQADVSEPCLGRGSLVQGRRGRHASWKTHSPKRPPWPWLRTKAKNKETQRKKYAVWGPGLSFVTSYYQRGQRGCPMTACDAETMFPLGSSLQRETRPAPPRGGGPCPDSTPGPRASSASRACPREDRSPGEEPDWPRPAHPPSGSSL